MEKTGLEILQKKEIFLDNFNYCDDGVIYIHALGV